MLAPFSGNNYEVEVPPNGEQMIIMRFGLKGFEASASSPSQLINGSSAEKEEDSNRLNRW